ncbi:UNVERIFIED_CONTAM: hypothetical protein OHV15_05935 [Microbacterium sp. SLM126]
MSDEVWKPVSGIMMTTERIGAYGGFKLDRMDLEHAAASIKANGLPMHLEHDLSKPLRIRDIDALVETRADGIDVLRFTAEIHPDDAHWAEALGKVSFTMMRPLDRPDEEYVEPNAPIVSLSADHAWFSDEAILAAESSLRSAGIDRQLILSERAFQFGLVPDPQIFLSVAMDLITGVGSSAIWESIVGLFRSRLTPPDGDAAKETVINVTVTDGDTSFTARVETNSDAVALRALDGLTDVTRSLRGDPADSTPDVPTVGQPPAAPPPILVWDDGSHRWAPPT